VLPLLRLRIRIEIEIATASLERGVVTGAEIEAVMIGRDAGAGAVRVVVAGTDVAEVVVSFSSNMYDYW
jgi:hypothetical protein